MIANCRTLDDRIPGCQFISAITGAENTYFERAFEQMGCSNAEQRNAIPNTEATDGFLNLMKDVASSGNLSEMLAVLVVCEWSYGTWGELVVADTKRDDFVCYEWVDLHSGESFQSVVAYLRGLLDKEEEFLKNEEKERVKARFLETISLEKKFFDDAYIKA